MESWNIHLEKTASGRHQKLRNRLFTTRNPARVDQYKNLPSELHVVLGNIRLTSRYHDFPILLQRAVSCYEKISQCGLVWRRIIHLSCSMKVLALDITELISKYAGFFLGWGGRKGPHSKMDWMKKNLFFPLFSTKTYHLSLSFM